MVEGLFVNRKLGRVFFCKRIREWNGSLKNRGKEREFLANRLKSGRTLK